MKVNLKKISITQGVVVFFLIVMGMKFIRAEKGFLAGTSYDQASLRFTVSIDVPTVFKQADFVWNHIEPNTDEPPLYETVPITFDTLAPEPTSYKGTRIFIQAADRWSIIDILKRTISPGQVEYLITNQRGTTIRLMHLGGGHWELYDRGRKWNGVKPSHEGRQADIELEPGYHVLKIYEPS